MSDISAAAAPEEVVDRRPHPEGGEHGSHEGAEPTPTQYWTGKGIYFTGLWFDSVWDFTKENLPEHATGMPPSTPMMRLNW